MKPGSKNKLTFFIFLLCVGVGILFIASMLYTTLGKQKTTGMITSAINISSADQIYDEKKYKNMCFAVKVQENNSNYLKVFNYNEKKDTYIESRLDMNKKDFGKLQQNKYYYFSVKLYNKDNENSGKITEVFTQNPNQK